MGEKEDRGDSAAMSPAQPFGLAIANLVSGIENSASGILIADAPDGRIRFVNEAALAIRGPATTKLTNIPIEQHPSNWQCFRPDGTPFPAEELPLSRALLTGEIIGDTEVIIRREDGEDRWVLANAAPIRDLEGAVTGAIVVFTDITERKLAEKDLAHKLSFHSLLTGISESLLAADETAAQAMIEAALERLAAHFKADEISFWWIDDARRGVHKGWEWRAPGVMPQPEYVAADALPRLFENLFAGEVSAISDFELSEEYAKERAYAEEYGTTAHLSVPISVRGGVVGSAVANVYGGRRSWTASEIEGLRLAFNILATIELRRRSELALREQSHQLERAQAVAHVGSFVYDMDAEFGTLSAEAKRIMGTTDDEITVAKVATYIHPDDRERAVATIRQGLAEETLFSHEFRVQHPDGTMRRVAERVEVLPERRQAVVTWLDVTEDREREAALAEALAQVRELQARLQAENVHLEQEVRQARGVSGFVGSSPAIQSCLADVARVAPTNATVLIVGETGTGKELIARAIHDASTRSGYSLVAVNCAALPEGLIENELFGHERGAFTGADRMQMGCFELADGGTLFLDEIGEMPLELQGKLLRAIQEGEIQRLGSQEVIEVDVRIVAATNRDLKDLVDQDRFRSDLYYRLNVFQIALPPLRERQEDIPALAQHIIDKVARRFEHRIDGITPEAMASLCKRPWPGNVRELENVIERAIITAVGPKLQLDDFPPDGELFAPEETSASGNGNKSLEDVEREHITRVLESTDWRIEGPAGDVFPLDVFK